MSACAPHIEVYALMFMMITWERGHTEQSAGRVLLVI